MKSITIKEIVLKGRMATAADKYYEPPPGPTQFDVRFSYEQIGKFLRDNAQPLVPEKVKVLPFLSEGIITSPMAASCYEFNDCLVMNGFRPYWDLEAHIVRVASYDKQSLENTIEIIKDRGSAIGREYWLERNERQVEVPEALEGPEVKELSRLVLELPEKGSR